MDFEKKLTSHRWALERPNGEIRSSFVSFANDSKILGYKHPNEATWELNGECLTFHTESGMATSISGNVRVGPNDELIITMMQANDPSVIAHYLRDLGPLVDSKKLSSIVWENAEYFAFEMTPAIDELLTAHRIYSSALGKPR